MSTKRPLIIILLGAAGSGKGTQALMMQNTLKDCQMVNVGAMLRKLSNNHENNPDALKIKEQMLSGNLLGDVADKLVFQKIQEQSDKIYSYILDGYPRNVSQYLALKSFIKETWAGDVVVFYMKAILSSLVDRLMSRISCDECGAIYNALQNPDKSKDICSHCQSPIKTRDDDNNNGIKKRHAIFISETEPMIKMIEQELPFYEINAMEPQDIIGAKINAILKKLGH